MAKAKKTTHQSFLKTLLKILRQNTLPIFLSLVLIVLMVFAYQKIMGDKFYPLTYVGSTNISFLTKGQAIKLVEANFQKRSQQQIVFSYPQGSFTFDLATSSASLDYAALDKHYKNTHQKNWVFYSPAKINPTVTTKLDEQLEKLSLLVNKNPENAKLTYDETPNPEGSASANIQITEGITGLALNQDAIKKEVTSFLLTGKYQSAVPIKAVLPKVTTKDVIKIKAILEKVASQPIQLTFQDKQWLIDTKQLLTLLDLETGEDSLLDQKKTESFLKNIALEIDQSVQEGLFEFNPDNKKVMTFRPSQEGRKLDITKTYQLLVATLTKDKTLEPFQLPVDVVRPKVSTSDVNNLGIQELLGRGVSNFAGSIANRIFNVGLTASKINGVLIPPGETFSFNQTIGDISAATGFKQAYVIKEGRTVLDDGGGVCQGSTTLFRAALNAGLPIVKRTAHAYRVGYYEQGFPPGLDATVFHPSVDFQFKNDTLAHILIQAYAVGNTIYVDLYGTSDGRIVDISTPVITNKTPPPSELRQDDPTLPKGTVKQVDWAASGASVAFKRTVTRNGEVIANETWRSNYKPWQAIYLVGIQ